MPRHYILKSLNEKSLLSLSEFLALDGDKVIYIDSTGGSYAVMEAALHMLESTSTLLVAMGDIASCALTLFLRYKGPRQILPSAHGVAHLSAYTLNTREILDPDSSDHFVHNYYVERERISDIDFYSDYLTTPQLERFSSGKEVHLTRTDLERMLSRSSRQ